MKFFAAVPKGLEYLLADELQALQVDSVKNAPGGIYFEADRETAMRVCLWSRLATRLYWNVASFKMASIDDLYEHVFAVDWPSLFGSNLSIAVSCHSKDNPHIKHTGFAALKIKDAIVDRFRDDENTRPDVDTEAPQIRIHAFIKREQVQISLDFTQNSLHQRGYRSVAGAAPIKENLAAALLIRGGWLDGDKHQGNLVDPMCGAGTLLIEAAQMALGIAPGRNRDGNNFLNWHGWSESSWQSLLDDADAQQSLKSATALNILGFDADQNVCDIAWENAQIAGVGDAVTVRCQRLDAITVDDPAESGLLISNPPYGKRLGDSEHLQPLYKTLGEKAQRFFNGWTLGIITTEKHLARAVGLRSHKQYKFFNGNLACQFYLYDVSADNTFKPIADTGSEPPKMPSDQGALMLRNRLQKNRQRLKSYIKQNQLEAYRIYDADLPEYAAAIDVYGDYIHVQEYLAPKSVPEKLAEQRLSHVVQVTALVFDIPIDNIVVKARNRQRGKQQYQRNDNRRESFEISENGLKFLINLNDYLDSGLFLDHRKTRKMVKDWSGGAKVLNLFGYTGSVSVYAASGGANEVVTVDSSTTYLEWAEKNFALNGLTGRQYQFVKADAVAWLSEQPYPSRYDIIFLDPPTFSNSKSRDKDFNVQDDHVALIGDAMRLLKPDGKLIFSNNFRRFKLDESVTARFAVENVTAKTLPKDFNTSRTHQQSWVIAHK